MPTRERLGTRAAAEDDRDPVSTPFGRHLQDALAHLYDPVYLQTHPLARMLQKKGLVQGPNLGQWLSRALVEAIEALKPGQAVTDPDTRRGYQLLFLRYVEALEVDEVQRRLGVGRRQYYRSHHRALGAVISLSQERWKLSDLPLPESKAETSTPGPVPESRASFPDQPGPARATDDFPLTTTSFVGREREMEEVRRLLEHTRLLTLTGSGGCGKTRLALQVAASLIPEYRDGVRVVHLATLADPSLVPQTVAFALGLSEEHDQPVTITLVNYLRPRRTLLLLDNCEHLLDACARLVEALLQGCPSLRLLLTSREALGIGGETRWRVPSLAAPPRERWKDDPSEVAKYEAVQLFVERARSVQPGFLLAADNASAVAEICCRLDGIPLAIELAATKVRVLSVPELARRLDDRFRLLTGGSRTALPRHQTLRATIDWSYELLGPQERIVSRRISVFAGGWTLEAAEAVCSSWPSVDASSPILREEVLGLITQLIDRSLISVEQTASGTRYGFLETIRQYAAEKLAEAGEEEEAKRRHRDWYVALAERELPNVSGREQGRCLPRLAAEHANFRAALTWSQSDPEGAEAELRLAAALARYWRWTGRWMEAAAWLDEALARCGPIFSSARARALTTLGIIETLYGRNLDRAVAVAEEGVAVARAVGDQPLLAHALRQAALAQANLGDTAAALSRFDEALTVGRRAGDDREVCTTLYQKALLCYDPRDLEAIVRAMDEALSLAHGLGDGVLLAEILTWTGEVLVRARDYSRAWTTLVEALACTRSVNYLECLSWVVVLLGDVALLSGDGTRAVERYRESLVRELDRGSQGMAVESLLRVASLGAERGEYESAVRLFAWCDAQHLRRTATWVHWMIDRLGVPATVALQERALEMTRQGLSDAAFSRAWEAGRALTLEEAGEIGRSILRAMRAADTDNRV